MPICPYPKISGYRSCTIQCRYHFWAEVRKARHRQGRPAPRIKDIPVRCALMCIDIRGDHTLEEVSIHYEVTRERVRQIEFTALRKFKLACPEHNIDEAFVNELLAIMAKPRSMMARIIDGESITWFGE